MVMLSRDERRRRVLELHNQNMGTRDIAKLLHISFTDIAKILKDADYEKETEQQRTRQKLLSSQAYKLFSKGKKAVDVAIELSIRASDIITLQREYWDLLHLDSLNEIYRELKHDIWYFVELYRLAKTSGMNPDHVANLLVIANNDLPSVEYRYTNLKMEVNQLEEHKNYLERKLIELDNEITEKSNYVGHYQAAYQQEERKMNALLKELEKLEAVVRDFENNDAVSSGKKDY